MGSSASSNKPELSEVEARRQLLLQRKVTSDILEKLARGLPLVNNPLGKTLKLEKDKIKDLEWKANLSYLEDWKKWKKDEATIGNLINLLKSATHKPEDYECLFNISREPKNATTATERINESPRSSPSTPKKKQDILSKDGKGLQKLNHPTQSVHQPIKSRQPSNNVNLQTQNMGFSETPYQQKQYQRESRCSDKHQCMAQKTPIPLIKDKSDFSPSNHYQPNMVSKTPILDSFNCQQSTPHYELLKSYNVPETPLSTKHKSERFKPLSGQSQQITVPNTPLSTKISHVANMETPVPTTANRQPEETTNSQTFADYFTTLNTTANKDMKSNSGCKASSPVEKQAIFLTENKQISPQIYNTETPSDRQHTWIDYRDWATIDTSWRIGEIDNLEQYDMNSQPKIGSYLPGIVKLNQYIIVSDTNEKMLHYFTTSGQHYKSVSTGNLTPGGMCNSGQDSIAVCCGTVVAMWDYDGQYMGEFGRGTFDWCRGICMDQNDRYIITDIEANTVTIHSRDGHIINMLQTNETNHFNRPYYVTTTHRNQILVSDSRNHCIKQFDKNGSYLTKYGSFGGGPSQFRVPLGITTDCCGNVLISDYGNNRVSMYSSGGWFLKHILTRENQIGQPISMATIHKRKLALSTMGQNYLNVFEFRPKGERMSPLLDYLP